MRRLLPYQMSECDPRLRRKQYVACDYHEIDILPDLRLEHRCRRRVTNPRGVIECREVVVWEECMLDIGNQESSICSATFTEWDDREFEETVSC